MIVSALYIYPVKGCGAVQLQRAAVHPRGLIGDRRWMWVDAEGKFITQRSHPPMATIRPTLLEGGLRLEAEGHAPLEIPEPDADAPWRPVQVWSSTLDAPVAEGSAAWGRAFFGQPASLVFMGEGCVRPMKPGRGRPGDEVSFSDGYPLLLAHEASLTELNRRIVEGGGQPVPMERFRPNLIISGGEAFDEESWSAFTAGEVPFDAKTACERCTVTTLDQATGAKVSAEPLKTLAAFRRRDNKVYFGVNCIPRGGGEIAVGDQVSTSRRN